MGLFSKGSKKGNGNNNQSPKNPDATLEDIRKRKDLLLMHLNAADAQEEAILSSMGRPSANKPKEERAAVKILRERKAQEQQARQQPQPCMAPQAPPQAQPMGQAPPQGYPQYAIPAEKLQEDTMIGSYLITIYEQFPLSPSQKQALLIVINDRAPWYIYQLKQQIMQQQKAAQKPAAREETGDSVLYEDQEPGDGQEEDDLMGDLTGTGTAKT